MTRGNQVSAGVVEVNINSKWGSICDNEWSQTNTSELHRHFILLYTVCLLRPFSKCLVLLSAVVLQCAPVAMTAEYMYERMIS